MRAWAAGELGDGGGNGADDLQAAAAEWGLELAPQDDEPPPLSPENVIHLWPDNLPAWNCWHALQTQWRIGMAGATGLDYTGVLAYLERIEGLTGSDLREQFELMQACEAVTLREWAKKRESSKQ